jgi:hypothetical protein
MLLPRETPLLFFIRTLDSTEAWQTVVLPATCKAADVRAALGLAKPKRWCLYSADGLVCLEEFEPFSEVTGSFFIHPCTPEAPWWLLPRAKGGDPLALTADRAARTRARELMRGRLPLHPTPPPLALALREDFQPPG